MVSERARRIDVSGIRKVFARAAELKNPIDLSIGQPNFEAPAALQQAACDAIRQGANRYLPTQGLPELRDKIRREYALDDQMDVIITSGVTGGLTLSFLALLDPGDELLVPDPYFVVYKELATLFGITLRYYDTYPDFAPSAEGICAALGPNTKAVIVNSPGNPTGVTVSQEALDDIAKRLEARGIYLLYDEIYDAFCFDDAHARLAPAARRIILNGFSKTYGVPGWRLGFLIAPKELVQYMSSIQQYTFVCGNSSGQMALSKSEVPDFSTLRAAYRQRRDYLCTELAGKYEFVKPGGAFYLFPKAPGGDAAAFVEQCIAKELLVVPGTAFSRRNTHFRISFSTSIEQLERGVEVLRSLA